MKALLLIGLLFTAFLVHAQVLETPFVLDLSRGDTTIELISNAGAHYASCQITAVGLNGSDATFNIQKTNGATFGDVPDARGTFDAGDSIIFLEFALVFKNTRCILEIVTNSVTEGKLFIDMNTMRQ